MTLVKNSIPILEYDTDTKAMIMANRRALYKFPKKCVFAFLGSKVEEIAVKMGHEIIGEFESITKIYPVYKINYKGEEICYCQAPCGAAAATQIIEFLIGYGVEEIIACGSCGALEDIEENAVIIVQEALRDEGTSYKYIEPQRSIKFHPTAIQACCKALEAKKVNYILGKTWTTDGFFRETEEMVAYRRSEGCQVVEMEASAMAACATFRKAILGQLLFTADTLAHSDAYDERDWGVASYGIIFRLALEAVYAIGK